MSEQPPTPDDTAEQDQPDAVTIPNPEGSTGRYCSDPDCDGHRLDYEQD